MTNIRWGILSTANIGIKRVIPAIQKSNNGTVSAIASRNYERAKSVADEIGIPNVYGNYEELLASDEVDAIYIPLPNSMHAEWAIKCAEAGKPTLCEKPLASTADEAQTMVDAFKEKNILFAEAFMYRFHPQSQKVKQLVQDGEIGDLQVMNASFSFRLSDEANIRLSKELVGGALMDVGCYCINSMRFITGEEAIKAQALAHFGEQTDVDETITGILEFPSGMRGHLDASLRTFRVNTYEIRGTEGRILVPDSYTPSHDASTVIHFWKGNQYEEIKFEPIDQYQLMVEDFADALINNRPPKFEPQDAVENMRVVDMLLKSAREN